VQKGQIVTSNATGNNPNAGICRTRIGILNFQFSNHNFGAVLQATALAHCVSSLGYEVEHINYIPEFDRTLTLRSIAGKLLRVVGLRKSKKRAKGSEVFEMFRRKWLVRSPLHKSTADLRAVSCCYSAIIVGSDQVWRPNYTIGDPLVYFLNFTHEHCKRIAYAASFGSDRWLNVDPALTENVRALLSRFQHVSCREDTGVRICEEVFEKNARHVLDPTLLAGREFFENMLQGRERDSRAHKVVYYKLDLEHSFAELLCHLETQHGEPFYNIYFKNVGREEYYLEVEEWLLSIRNAKLVITDSYHCVCFAILFNKSFICLRNDSRGYTRIKSLLSSLSIPNRECSEQALHERFNQLLVTPIDYSGVNVRLGKLRQESTDFLVEALRDAQ
jgi:hypothetical protein